MKVKIILRTRDGLEQEWFWDVHPGESIPTEIRRVIPIENRGHWDRPTSYRRYVYNGTMFADDPVYEEVDDWSRRSEYDWDLFP